ncbi:alpha/beta hydrolase [Vibrio quintilis]|nr:alpha/beta hydrolase [Vibrio quintilis]
MMKDKFFKYLKELEDHTQLLLYIHGFNNNMEPDIFRNAAKLQDLLNQALQKSSKNEPASVLVVPVIWPCDDNPALALIDDYWDDQDAADCSGPGFARLLGKFDTWRKSPEQQEIPCFRRINILAHSMGNRVLKNALKFWADKYSSGQMPALFRNTFLVAADIPNEALEKGEDGRYIVDSSRNVVVYYANDDLAMPASKIANIKYMTLSRRMGMTGPETLNVLPEKVKEVDCDDFNNEFDMKGHSYFLDKDDGTPSPMIRHMADAIASGRVKPNKRSYRLRRT